MSEVMRDVLYTAVAENRERGGMCALEMEFVEYGDPKYRTVQSTPAQIEQSAAKAETEVMGPPAPETKAEAAPYTRVALDANKNDGFESI